MSKYKPQVPDSPITDLSGLTPDLTGFIGPTIFPFETMAKESAIVYYVPSATETAAQTNRANGADPTEVALASAHYDYAAGDVAVRFSLSEEEIANLGGYPTAEKLGLESAWRTVHGKLESLVALEVFSSENVATGANVDAMIQNALYQTRLVKGKIALVLSQTAKTALFADTSFATRLTNAKAAIPTAGEVTENTILRAMYGFDAILVGDDTYWTETAVVAVVRLPDPAQMSYRQKAILGRVFCFDSEKPELSVHDKDHKVCYDGIAKYDLAVLNADGICLIELGESGS